MRRLLTWVGDRYAGLAAILLVMIVAHRVLRGSALFAPDSADASAFALALVLGVGLLALLHKFGRGRN